MDPELAPEACHCNAARRAARQLTRAYDRRLASAGINTSQFSLLSVLQYTPGIAKGNLASRMGMDRTTLVRALQPLERDGLVESRPMPGDNRRLELSVTRRGLAKIREAAPMWAQAQQDIEQWFGVARARAVRAELRELADLP